MVGRVDPNRKSKGTSAGGQFAPETGGATKIPTIAPAPISPVLKASAVKEAAVSVKSVEPAKLTTPKFFWVTELAVEKYGLNDEQAQKVEEYIHESEMRFSSASNAQINKLLKEAFVSECPDAAMLKFPVDAREATWRCRANIAHPDADFIYKIGKTVALTTAERRATHLTIDGICPDCIAFPRNN
jgi:hypothetical protein